MEQENNDLPEIIILSGIPASGKSTWIKEHVSLYPEKKYVIISSDDIIENFAIIEKKTYNELFQKYIKQASDMMQDLATKTFADKRNIIWDQTNLTTKKRQNILKQAKGYVAKAVAWDLNEKELKKRLEKRKKETGKCIPDIVLDNMKKNYTIPSKDEGFSEVTIITN